MKNGNTKGKKSYQAKSQYLSADWNKAKPNTIHIGEKSAKYGNCYISVARWNGNKMIPFRAGHELSMVHPLTIITVYGEQPIKINTKRMYLYLHEKGQNGDIHLEMRDFGKLPNDAYRVSIADLVLYANIEDHPITDSRLGEIA